MLTTQVRQQKINMSVNVHTALYEYLSCKIIWRRSSVQACSLELSSIPHLCVCVCGHNNVLQRSFQEGQTALQQSFIQELLEMLQTTWSKVC